MDGDENNQNDCPPCLELRHLRTRCLLHSQFLSLPVLVLFSATLVPAQAREPAKPAAPLPVTPLPAVKHVNSKQGPCRVVPGSESAGKSLTATAAVFLATIADFPSVPAISQAPTPGNRSESTQELPPCPVPPLINFFERFINGPEVRPLSPKEKAWLAAKNVLDPFNAVTIGANSAITIGTDAHTPYGPGIPGFFSNVGVSYTEDMTSEFFGTFIIPSIFRQDPHYHRMPHAPIPRRILHAIVQVGWTQGDNGKGMPNYSNILGFPLDAEIANMYVPALETDLPATAARVAIGWGLAPTDNFITEFLPDVARHIHVRIVFVQQIINQVARSEPGGVP